MFLIANWYLLNVLITCLLSLNEMHFLIKTISVPSPRGKYITNTLTWEFFLHPHSQLSPLLVNFNMICLEACRYFCWAVFILVRDMKTSLTDSDLRTLQRAQAEAMCLVLQSLLWPLGRVGVASEFANWLAVQTKPFALPLGAWRIFQPVT